MNFSLSTPESVCAYEIVADCHVAGRSFLRGEHTTDTELADLRRFLLAAGLIRAVETVRDTLD